MIGVVIAFVVGAVAGGVSLYFILRNNPKKAAVVNEAVKEAGAVVNPIIKKL